MKQSWKVIVIIVIIVIAVVVIVVMGVEEGEKRTLIFTYGTLKRGFSNHDLIEAMALTGDAVYIGPHRTVERYPLVCGPYRVPFLLNLPGSGDRVSGELYAVSTRGLARMDELEGTSNGHYERRPVEIKVVEGGGGDGEEGGGGGGRVAAEAYYAHESYAVKLWKKSGEKGICVYSEKEARGYVKRRDRPQNLTFLQQIGLFVDSSDRI